MLDTVSPDFRTVGSYPVYSLNTLTFSKTSGIKIAVFTEVENNKIK